LQLPGADDLYIPHYWADRTSGKETESNTNR
jgi:hypothetical protein